MIIMWSEFDCILKESKQASLTDGVCTVKENEEDDDAFDLSTKKIELPYRERGACVGGIDAQKIEGH